MLAALWTILRSPLGAALSVGSVMGVLLCLTGLWGMAQQAQRQLAEADVVTLRAEIVQARADADARVAAIEESWRLRTRQAEKENARVQAQNDRRLAAAQRELDRVRSQIAAALDAPVPPGADPAATHRERAAACGQLLADALRAHAESTAAAERHAGDVRALLDSWPRTETPWEVNE